MRGLRRSRRRTDDRRLRPAGTVILCLLVTALPLSAGAQVVIDEGPAGPAWQIGYSGVPDTYQNDDRDKMFPFSWGWYGVNFDVVTTAADYNATGQPNGEVFDFRVPPTAELIVEDLDLVNPTGFTLSPTGEDIWIADYGNNQILKLDISLGTYTVIHDGNDPGSPLDGPWDVELGYFTRDTWYGGRADPRDWSFQVFVTSRDNNRILQMDLDGTVTEEYTHSNLLEPTELYCEPTRIYWTGGTWGCVDFWVSSFGGNAVYQFQPSFEIRDRSRSRFYNNSWPSIEKPMGLTSGFRYSGLVVAMYETGEIVRPQYRRLETVVSADAGLDHPTSIFIWDTTHEIFSMDNAEAMYFSGWRPTWTRRLYVLEPDNDRMVWTDYTDPDSVELYLADPDDVDRVALFRGSVHTGNGDFYALDLDDVTGHTSITRYPGLVGLTVETLNAPQEAVLGVSPRGFFSRAYRSWLFDDAVGGDRITIPAYRDRVLNFHLGFTDPAAAASADLRATTSVAHELPRPVLEVDDGPVDNSITVSVETLDGPTGAVADEVILYELVGCDEPVDVAVSQDGTWMTYFRFPHVTHSVNFTLGDLDECGVEVGRMEADPSGTTTFELDAIFPASSRYCFMAVQRDLDQNIYSDPSSITDVDSCVRPDEDGVEATFCHEPLPAAAHDSALGYHLNQAADPGQPAWYDYTVAGQPGESRLLFAWVNQPVAYVDEAVATYNWINEGPSGGRVEGGHPLITIYDDCPTSGGTLLAEDHWAVPHPATAGDSVKIRVTHFEQLNPTWMILDLSSEPTTELSSPRNLTATSDMAGMVELCWDAEVELDGIPVHPDFVYFKVLRGPVGGPVDTVLEEAGRQRCFWDVNLAPNVSYDYEVVTVVKMRMLPHQIDALVLESAPTASATGTTNGADLTGSPLVVPPPNSLEVRHIDPNDQNYFLASGTLVWWDPAPLPSEHRVQQTHLNSGTQASFILDGGANAAEIPPDEIGLYCYDVFARRANGAGEIVESVVTGYSEVGDPTYCVNLCEDAATTVNLGPGRYRSAEALVQRPVDYFVFDPTGYTGLFHLTNDSGNAARVCAWQGESACDDLELMGCANPNASGNVSMDFVITDGSEPIYVMWELIPQGDQSYEDLHAIRFMVGFSENTVPESQAPTLALNVSDNSCSSRVLIDYVAANWEPKFDSYISFRVGGVEVDTTSNLVGTMTLSVNPIEPLHEIEAIIFDTPLEAALTRRIYTAAGPSAGDINEDCSLDVGDVVLLIRHVLGLSTLNETEQQVADFVPEAPLGLDIVDVVGMVSHIMDNL